MKKALLLVALLSGMHMFGAAFEDDIDNTSEDEKVDDTDFRKVQALYKRAYELENAQKQKQFGSVLPLGFSIEKSLWRPKLEQVDKILMEGDMHPDAWPGLSTRLSKRGRDLYGKGLALRLAMANEGQNVRGVDPLSLLSADEKKEYKSIRSYLDRARDDARFFNHALWFENIKDEVMPIVEPLFQEPLLQERLLIE